MKLIYYSLLLILVLTLPNSAKAQNLLRGTVRDHQETMIGVNVVLMDAENRVITGATTNMNGQYFINIPQGIKFIEYSFIGYKVQKIEYTGQTVIDITLQEDVATLDEFVLTARAVERSSTGVPTKDLGIARQRIELDDFQDMPVTSVEDMLQGKLANVDIISGSGDPGTRSSIRIRGTSSLNASNEPLIVIDEIPIETEISSDFDFATATDEDFGALVNIAPSDIEAIEVLKDAAATAIWGSKAANGVLLITTKKGSRGKPRFSVTQKFDFKKEPKGIPMLNANQYVSMMQDAIWNYVREYDFARGYISNLTNFKDIRYDPTYKYFDEFNQDTDWLDLVTKNQFNSETNFSMSGGGERAAYRFSAGYLNEGGTTRGTGLTRITTRLNVDYNLSQKLRASASFSYTESNKENNYMENVRSHARYKMPNMSPWVIGEDGLPTNEYFTNPTDDPAIQGTWSSASQYNPLAMTKDSKNNTTVRTMRVSFSLRYDILKGLIFSEDLAFDLSSTKTKRFLPSSATGVPWTSSDYNRGEDNMSDAISVTSNSKLIYNYSFNDLHKIIITGIAQINDYTSKSQTSSVSGLGSHEVTDPTSGASLNSISTGSTEARSIRFVGQAHYNYADRYMITVGLSREGSSKLGKNNRWATFPTLQAAWRISDEYFLIEKPWLDELKFRGSWGKSGNAPTGNYTYIGKFQSNGTFMDMTAVRPSSIQLNNLKREITTAYNIGLDFSFLNNFSIVLEYYKKVTNDLLQTNVPISSSSGFSSVGYFNSGKSENRGWEIIMDFKNIIKRGDFTFSITNLNLSRNRNRIRELPSNLNFETYTFGNGQYASNVVIGNPIGSFYGYRYMGVYQNYNETLAKDRYGNVVKDINGEDVVVKVGTYTSKPGDAHYADINYDGIIDKYDIVYLGNSMPILTAGGSLFFTYKNIRLRASFQSRIGQSIINRARMNSESMFNANNQSTAVLRRWRFEGDDTSIPRALYQAGYNYLGSDRFVEKASFLRMKDVMLSYSLPKRVIQRLGLTNFSCYVTCYDVFTWTNYKGQNPEVGFSKLGGVNQIAIDDDFTPRPIRIALGVTVDF